jgi:phosphate-selective porin OprO/OprP
MKTNIRILTSFILIAGLLSGPTFAADTSNAELLKRLEDLEQQVAILKRQIENNNEETSIKAKETPIVSASTKDGFSIKSPDESFKLKLRGLLQTDGRIFTGNSKDLAGTTDNFLVRRARPIFEGSVGKNFDFYLMPDFANNSTSQAILVDAYTDFKVTPWFKVRGGKFKAPLGLERLQSDAVANFIEIGLLSNLVPNRDVGFEIFGDVLGETTNYTVGIFNGGPDLASNDVADTNNDKDVIGRIFTNPFKSHGPEALKGLGLGIAGSYGHREGTTMPTYRSPGQASVFTYSGAGLVADGTHSRVSPQAYFYKGSFGILGEYVRSSQELSRTGVHDSFSNQAWQLSSNYVLTGEVASYKGITPRANFDPAKGAWGAFEVVGRYGVLKLDDKIFDEGFGTLTAATGISKEEAWAAGLNWYPTKNIKLALNYEQTHFSRGAAANEDRPTESLILTRFQLAY